MVLQLQMSFVFESSFLGPLKIYLHKTPGHLLVCQMRAALVDDCRGCRSSRDLSPCRPSPGGSSEADPLARGGVGRQDGLGEPWVLADSSSVWRVHLASLGLGFLIVSRRPSLPEAEFLGEGLEAT